MSWDQLQQVVIKIYKNFESDQKQLRQQLEPPNSSGKFMWHPQKSEIAFLEIGAGLLIARFRMANLYWH